MGIRQLSSMTTKTKTKIGNYDKLKTKIHEF